MKVKWLGHACFLLTSESGLRIITDPYVPGMYGLDYAPPSETADIVTVSHDHADHNNVAAVKGDPQVVKGSGIRDSKGIQFKGVATAHDPSGGKERGPNTVFIFALDGVTVCHVGDLGHDLNDQTVAEIGAVDILLIPVGGNFTVDAIIANEVCERLKPKVCIPMHFKNSRCPDFPVAGVDDFVGKRQQVRRLDASEVEISQDKLPVTTETVVLTPAL
jgi:L-ascorbate metabolism protein UlaG (beta-lactamase superfamily)